VRQRDRLHQTTPPGPLRIAVAATAGAFAALAYRLPFGPMYRSFAETQSGGPYWWAALLHPLILGFAAMWVFGVWNRPASEPPGRLQLVPSGAVAFVSFVAALVGTMVWLIRPVDWLFTPLQRVPPSLVWALAGGVVAALGAWARRARDDIGWLRRRFAVSAACVVALFMMPRGLTLLARTQPPPPDVAFQAAAQLGDTGRLRDATRKAEDVIKLIERPDWMLQTQGWYLRLARSERKAGSGDQWLTDANRARAIAQQLADMPKAKMEAATASNEFTRFVDDIFKESDATRRRGNLEEATRIGEQAISLDPTSAVYKYITGFSYLKLATLCQQTAPSRVPELNRRALQLTEDAVKLAPNDDSALAYHGAALLRNGNKTDASLQARKALRINSHNQVARMVLDRTGGL
jgi:tetratricopeptide (TPR) repeat protein